MSRIIGFCSVVTQKEILASRNGDRTAVKYVGFSGAGGDALDQSAAVVAKDHDIAGLQFSKLAQAEDEAALVDGRFHRCGRHVPEIEDEPEQDQHQERA